MKDYILLFLFSTCFSLNTFGQETVKITTGSKKSYDSEVYYVLKANPEIKHGLYQKLGYKNRLETEGYYKNGLKDSIWTDYGYSGKIISQGYYKNDKMEGFWKTYFSDGSSLRNQGNYKDEIRIGIWEFYEATSGLIQKYNFDTGELLYNNTPTNQSLNVETEILTDDGLIKVKLDRPVVYLGGTQNLLEKIHKNLRYTEKAMDNGTQGKVVVSFLVGKDGKAYDFQIVEGLKDGLDEEAIRLAKLTQDNWIPAIYNGEPVTSRITVPIKFKLNR